MDLESLVDEVLDEAGVGGARESKREGDAAPRAPGVPLYLAEFPANLESESRTRTSNASGVFDSVDAAVAAGERAFHEWGEMTLEARGAAIEAIRRCALESKRDWAERTVRETGMGRVDHKERKFELVARKTPGIEILRPECFTGDRGMTVDELAPFGVVAAVTPRTHPAPTLVNNAISLLAAGNSAVFNAHPASKGVFAYAVEGLNEAIRAAGGPANLISCIGSPTIETGQALFAQRGVALILVTGGPGVVREALRAPKRAICAGPGNPPVVVDETADLGKAAASIVDGGAFDNNVLCIGEKQVLAVDAIVDRLIDELVDRGCRAIGAREIERLTQTVFARDERGRPTPRPEWMGRDAAVMARAIGVEARGDPPLLVGETPFDHPFVQREQMMPFMPIVRCRNAEEAIDRAIESEHGYRHTAVIHSLDIRRLHDFARRARTTILVKNGSSAAGLASGGEGTTSFSIAGTTGEGLTTARTFTRPRRCTLVDYFRIV